MALTSANTQGRRPVVLCAGIAVEDFIFQVERFPQPGEKAQASTLIATPGGCAPNAAVAVARLGGVARFAGPVGTDEASARFLDGLARTGVDTSGIERVDGGSISVSGIFIDATGEKLVATRRGELLAQAQPRDAAALVADIDIVMADNRFPDFVQPILQAAAQRGIPTVLDGDQATTPDHPLLAIASHIIFSSEALRATTGADDLAAALKVIAKSRSKSASISAPKSASMSAPGFLAVTNGPEAIQWLEHGEVRRMPAFPVEAVDTLGAGDTFHGAFALALAEGRDLLPAMRFAAAAAALKCTRIGGISGTPARAEVDAFLALTKA
jgi:sugar/nucleoside kinase (ribokinase family)